MNKRQAKKRQKKEYLKYLEYLRIIHPEYNVKCINSNCPFLGVCKANSFCQVRKG